MELNRALQRRENNRRQKEFKKKKLLERDHTRDFGEACSETDNSGRGGPPRRKVWFCNVHGNQTDHARRERRSGSAVYMGTRQITLPNGGRLYTLSFYRSRPSLFKPGITYCIESKQRSRRQKPSERCEIRLGGNFVSVNCNLVTGEVCSDRRIYDTGAGANVVNRFQRKLIRKFRHCQEMLSELEAG